MQGNNDIWINVYDEEINNLIRMKLSDAVVRMIINELPDKFDIEAIKAFTVVMRTTIAKKLKRFDGIGCEKYKGADISTGMKGCQNITNLKRQEENIGEKFKLFYELVCQAERDTNKLIITCGGHPILANYHLACGGGTENSEDVQGNTIMYLRKVLCSYCAGENSPYFENVVDIPVSEIEDKLKVKTSRQSGVFGPTIEGTIDEIERDETGRVKKIRIGGKYFTGIEMKNLLGLSSSRFGWDPLVIRFRIRGVGDGLGMCLYGSNTMAKNGKTYLDILKYYYTNINIEKIEIAGEGVPLKGKVFVIDAAHGGDDCGDQTGPTGLEEKNINLYIAKKLSEYLEKNGAKAILTRNDDYEISLLKRVEIINTNRPNFLISIHQNYFFSPKVSGTEVFYFRGDIEGEKMSKKILDNITRALGTANRGNKQADLFILRESKVSSIVVQSMYISSIEEEKRLREDIVKDEIAKSIYRGIMEYYGVY